MTSFLHEILDPIERLLKAIQNDRNLLIGPKTAGFGDQRITVENLEDAAGNHFFDDNPGLYNITKMEAHKIRGYFQEGCITYNFVVELHKAFPNIIEEERKEYIKRINRCREKNI